jgi:hypothetical protein
LTLIQLLGVYIVWMWAVLPTFQRYMLVFVSKEPLRGVRAGVLFVPFAPETGNTAHIHTV